MRQNDHFLRPVALGVIDKQLAKVHPRLGVHALGPYFTDEDLLSLNIVAAAQLTFSAAVEMPRNPAAFLAASINRNRDRWVRTEPASHICDFGPESWGDESRGHCIECGTRRPEAGE